MMFFLIICAVRVTARKRISFLDSLVRFILFRWWLTTQFVRFFIPFFLNFFGVSDFLLYPFCAGNMPKRTYLHPGTPILCICQPLSFLLLLCVCSHLRAILIFHVPIRPENSEKNFNSSCAGRVWLHAFGTRQLNVGFSILTALVYATMAFFSPIPAQLAYM